MINKDTLGLIAKLFVTISAEEQNIELKRQNLCNDVRFDPLKAFQALDSDEDGVLTADEIVAFMKNNFVRLSEEEAHLIVKEYDANLDENLDFEEFTRLALPSTNPALKEISVNRSNSPYRREEPISQKLLSQMAELIDTELRFQKKRNEIKRQLLQRPDFTKQNYFNFLAKGNEKIRIENIVEFLREQSLMNPKKEELEAFLRRCDHEADQMISFDEFCEIVSSNDNQLSNDNVDEKLFSSNSKKELQKDLERSPPKRSGSKTDLYEKSLDQTMEQYSPDKEGQHPRNKRGEEVKKNLNFEEQEENEDKQSEEKPLALRYLALLRNQIKLDKEVEIQKEILYSHALFGPAEAFKILDRDSKGKITNDDLNHILEGASSPESIARFITKYDLDNDEALSYAEFLKAVTPKNQAYQHVGDGRIYIDPQMKDLLNREWQDDMKEVLMTAIRAEEILLEIRDSLGLDGEEIFALIDQRGDGYITSRGFSYWLKEKVGFNLKGMENDLIMSRYDLDQDYRISKDEFIQQINALNANNEEEEEEGEQMEEAQMEEGMEDEQE